MSIDEVTTKGPNDRLLMMMKKKDSKCPREGGSKVGHRCIEEGERKASNRNRGRGARRANDTQMTSGRNLMAK